MSMVTPLYSERTVLIQSVIVIIFSFTLYFFLFFMEEEKQIHQELSTLAYQQQQMEQVEKNIKMYGEMLAQYTDLQRTDCSDQSWEKVEFLWESIQFSELLTRVASLYQQDKIFVFESFETELEREETASDASVITEQRFHHLQGYFLCPYL